MEHNLLSTTEWFNPIINGLKQFDFRKGFRDIKVGDIVTFLEADKLGNQTGNYCRVKVNYVVHSDDFPAHFGWVGHKFTIFQFVVI